MKSTAVIFNPHEKEILLYALFDNDPKLQGIMEQIIKGFEEINYEEEVQGKRDRKSILELLQDDEEEYVPLLKDFYQNGCGYNKKEDLPIRRRIEAGIFYTICKLMLVRCEYRKGLNKLLYAATFPDLPARFTPLYLFRLGSINIDQGKIVEAGDRLVLAKHRVKLFADAPIMPKLEPLILYQTLRVNIIKGSLNEAKKNIDELEKKLKGEDEENIIFSSLKGYYHRSNREIDKGIEVLEKAYNRYKRNNGDRSTYSRSWFNTLYQLAFCYLLDGNKNKAHQLIMEASLDLNEFDYRNLGYTANMQGHIALAGDKPNLEEAKDYFQKAYDYFEKYHDYRNMARARRDLGLAYFKMKNYSEALKNFNQSLDDDHRTQLDIGIVQTYLYKIDLRNELIQYYKSREYLVKIHQIKLYRKHYLQDEIKEREEYLNNIDKLHDGIIGESKQIVEIKNEIKSYSKIDDPLLIIGERGVGKTFIARFIHEKSNRDGEFNHIHCPSISSNSAESEIFGHVKGAFTGALTDKVGLLDTTDQGTVYFDDICALPIAVQIKLMLFVNDKKIRPVGGNKDKAVDVRLIFGTNRDIQREITSGRFSRDFHDCISDFMIKVPSLRERKEDIKKLAEFFFVGECKKLGKNICGITLEALNLMEDYPWFGNVRELQKVIKRCVVKLGEGSQPISKEMVRNALESVAIRSRGRVARAEPEEIEEKSPGVTRITDSSKIINDVFKVIQQQGPIRKSTIIDYCPHADKSFHHWINILKDKHQVIEENKMGNFKIYTPVLPDVLKQKLRNKELEKDDNNIYSVVE